MKKILLIFFVSLCNIAISQTITKTPYGIQTTADGLSIEIRFISAGIARIIKSPEGMPFRKESLSVIKKPETVHPVFIRHNTAVTLKTGALQVDLDLQTGKVAFSIPGKEILFTEKDHGTRFTRVNDAGQDAYRVKQAFGLDESEAIYGLGQQQNGKLNQRGQNVYLKQENMKVAIPFFQSVKGYGIFWDNYSPTTFADSPQETSFESEVGACADYYFLMGGSADGVIARMRDLTGQAPMMPLWVFGFNQSRERYKTQYELVDVIRKYRSLKIPLDGIIQDWQYWGKDSNWNAMSFDPVTYPSPRSMVDTVHQLNAHLFIVTWPGFGPLTKQYAEMKEKGMLIDFDTWPPKSGTKPYDVYDPAARDIFWRYLNKGVFSLDIDAWWLDSSEPDHINVKDSDEDLQTWLGSLRKVRNAFPLQHVSGVYDHQRKTTGSKRVSILTRSAFAGQQRYGANTWSGDVSSDWKTFRKQIPAGLNFSLCGIPYWNTDIGGFFAGAYVKGGGAKDPEFRELYTRWMQFATFTPMMRSHGTDIPREIYQFGQRGDTIFDVQEKFIKLRYSLLPYSYSAAWNVTSHAGSFFRALYMDFAKDKKVLDIDNEFMYGKSFLVAPVTEKGIKMQPVYLPAGTAWYDFWTGETIDGGTTVSRNTPMDILPLYVRAGSIVPWGPKVQYAEEKKWNDLELRIYPGADADFTLYEDENNGYNYEKGIYSEIAFHWNNASGTLTINNRKGNFPGMPGKRKFNIIVVKKGHGNDTDTGQKADKVIEYNGKPETIKLIR